MSPSMIRLIAAAIALALPGLAFGQGLGFNLGAAPGGQPIEISADNGIEWQRDQQVYIARGNARAARGPNAVLADTLTAHYRNRAAGGGTEIDRVDAVGSVRLSSPTQTAEGDTASYDVPGGTLVMKGKALRLTTPREIVTAKETFEYFDQRLVFVARGDAVVVRDQRRMRADRITSFFKRDANGATVIDRMEADGNVLVTSGDEVARGKRGVYRPDTGIATLSGAVKITRGENQLNGEHAEVNFNTGNARLLAAAPGAPAAGRAQGLIQPKAQPKTKPAPAPKPAAKPAPKAAPKAP